MGFHIRASWKSFKADTVIAAFNSEYLLVLSSRQHKLGDRRLRTSAHRRRVQETIKSEIEFPLYKMHRSNMFSRKSSRSEALFCQVQRSSLKPRRVEYFFACHKPKEGICAINVYTAAWREQTSDIMNTKHPWIVLEVLTLTSKSKSKQNIRAMYLGRAFGISLLRFCSPSWELYMRPAAISK